MPNAAAQPHVAVTCPHFNPLDPSFQADPYPLYAGAGTRHAHFFMRGFETFPIAWDVDSSAA